MVFSDAGTAAKRASQLMSNFYYRLYLFNFDRNDRRIIRSSFINQLDAEAYLVLGIRSIFYQG